MLFLCEFTYQCHCTAVSYVGKLPLNRFWYIGILDYQWLCCCSWIYSTLPANKQMITLSATYPESLAQHITSYMRSPVFVRLNAKDPSLLGSFFSVACYLHLS